MSVTTNLAAAAGDAEDPAIELRHIPIDQIERSPRNPRRDETPTEEMVDSVRRYGILQPVIVRPLGDGYELIAGHRRLSAAQAAELPVIPAVVRVEEDLAALELTLIENLHRQDLSPLEEAEGYLSLAGLGLTQRQIAEKVGVSQPLVSKRLGLLKLPEKARAELDSGGITIEQATALAALPPEKVEKVLAKPNPRERVWEIEHAVREHAWEKKREKTTADLEAKGIRIVTERPGWNRAHPPTRLTDMGLPEGLDHTVEPCHAAYVGRDGTEVIQVCTEPGRHPERAQDRPAMHAPAARPAPARETPEQQAERERIQSRARTKAEGIVRRKEFCQQLLAQPSGWHTGDVIALASYMFTCNDGYETDVAAGMCLLGLNPDWQSAAVDARARITDDQKWGTRFLFALALDLGLAVIVNDGYHEDREADDPALQPVRFFLAWLEAHGYEFDDVERTLLYGEQLSIDDAAGEDDEAGAETDEAPTFTVEAKGKRFLASCSVCGPLSKVGNTTASYAHLQGTNHLFHEHGITA